MIENDFDPWFGGENELNYLKGLKKLKKQNIIPFIVLSEKHDGNQVETLGGISPILLYAWGEAQRVAISKMGRSIYDGTVRVLAHALLCACGGDSKLAEGYIKRDCEMRPELAKELREYALSKKNKASDLKKEQQLVRELNRRNNNKPKMEGAE